MGMRKCLRCGHDWRPRVAWRPVQCPDCKSPYWDRERRGVASHAKPVVLGGGEDAEVSLEMYGKPLTVGEVNSDDFGVVVNRNAGRVPDM
jgi:hypothetical protein